MKTKPVFFAILLFQMHCAVLFSQSSDKNYLLATEIIDAAITDPLQIDQLANKQKRSQITYFDGLGRAIQEITFFKSTKEGHIVQPIEYDGFGRVPQHYLPFVHPANTGDFIDHATQLQADFYTKPPDGIEATAFPYAETSFEDSPLNRKLADNAPGEVWAKRGGDKPVSYNYGANEANEVRLLKVDQTGNLYNLSSYYQPGKLYKQIVTDENKNTSIAFTDLQGRQILQRRIVEGDEGNPVRFDTYYVYNDLGLLARVVMPAANLETGTFHDYQHTFGYVYDSRNRLVEKHLPGAEPVYYVYDERDRLRFEQDGKQRMNNVWKCLKYDGLNRLVLEGLYQPASNYDRAQLQNLIYHTLAAMNEERSNSIHGYTNNLSFPESGNYIFTSYYFDDYDLNRNGTSDFSQYLHPASNFSDEASEAVKGQMTAMRTSTDFEHNKLLEVYYYDEKYRLVQTLLQNNNEETLWFTGNVYNFGGMVLQTNKELLDTKGSSLVGYSFKYDYDHDWRLTKTSLMHKSQETQLSALSYTETGMLRDKILHPDQSAGLYQLNYSYNVRGWLTEVNSLQSINPALKFGMELFYNKLPKHAESHAAPQYNGNISAMQWYTHDAEADDRISGYAYNYDALSRLTDALLYRYNDKSVSYAGYEQAIDRKQNWGRVTGIGSVSDIKYDKNGNILSLKRYARNDDECFLFDDLAYYYDYNRLKAVDDEVLGQNDLGDYHDNGLYYSQHQTAEFYYDANGNMELDMNRNLKIRYGIMHNLPIYISYRQTGGGGSIGTIDISVAADKTSQAASTSYSGSMMNHYTMHGRKMAKKVYNDQHTLTLNESYYDELMLNHRQPARISHADGYVSLDEHGEATFYYYLTDHLGNVRSVITPDADGKPQVEQANDYFPFGMSFKSKLPLLTKSGSGNNKFKYNGKEEQEMPGKWLDYGARYYDPALGRWHSADPMSEIARRWTPYQYAYNNPIRYIDPDGMMVDEYEFDSKGNINNVKSSETDSFHKVDENGDRIEGGSLQLNKKVVTGEVTLATNEGKEVDFLKVNGDENATQVFDFLANNTTESSTEIGLTRIGETSGEAGQNMIGVNVEHVESGTYANIAVFDNGYTIREANHSHPNDNIGSSIGDIAVAKKIHDKFPKASFNNYTKTFGFTPYDQNTIPGAVIMLEEVEIK